PDSELRDELNRATQWLSSSDIKFDWMGDWAAIGVANRGGLWNFALATGEIPQRTKVRGGDDAIFDALSEFPLYVAVHVREPLGLAAMLTGARAMVMGTAPDMISWEPDGKHRDVSIVTITELDGVR